MGANDATIDDDLTITGPPQDYTDAVGAKKSADSLLYTPDTQVA